MKSMHVQLDYGDTPGENGIYIAFTWRVDNSHADKDAKAISQMQHDGTIACIKRKYSAPLDNRFVQEN